MAEILVTGANGQLGRRLIATLPDDCAIAAVVRSERARRKLLRDVGEQARLTVAVLDPADPAALRPLAARCTAAVHLIGTIKEARNNRYVDSHQRPLQALLAAAAQTSLERIVYVSILGASAASDSRCLRARWECEQALLGAEPAAAIIRVPMVLGEGDRASRAIARRVSRARANVFRAASLEQPIYAGDVVAAIGSALSCDPPMNAVLDLAGPESLTRGELLRRAARRCGREVSVRSLPLAFGLFAAGLTELFSARPPVTRDMLRILDHDDAIDPWPAARALGITLTPLDVMLERCLPPGAAG